jgi:hypothetical protein
MGYVLYCCVGWENLSKSITYMKRLTAWFYKPFVKMMRDLSYHIEKVFAVDILALQHGNDGLI